MPHLLFFPDITAADAARVGGKGFSLGKMAAAGLPVPPGFVVTTEAYRRLHREGVRSEPGFVRAVGEAYRSLGAGAVAVRSSATAEDADDTSFAGQQETILGVTGEADVLDAVERCWRSLHTERAVAYRQKQGVADDALAMAVVVQVLVPADVAGVLFTRDPLDPAGRRMLVEASWGLGEAVVSGRVTPDRFHLDRDTGAALDRHLGHKAVRVTAAGEEHVPAGQQGVFCLTDDQLKGLAALGRRVEQVYGDPRDAEWALAGGRFFLLQARPITAATAAEREQVRREVVADLQSKAEPGGTVWVRYNLSEVLPQPTPMTWAVVQRLVAADGGFGWMNRDLGANPDPALGSQGAFDLVAGRPMANLSRLPRMQFADPPFEYPFAGYRADPRLALDPKPKLVPLRGGVFRGCLKLPATMLRLSRAMSATRKQSESFAGQFPEIADTFAKLAKLAMTQDWAKLDGPALVRELDQWIDLTLVRFAQKSLKPTVLADLAWSTLVGMLTPTLGAERARAAVAELSLGVCPPPGADLAAAVRALAAGEATRAAFLERFGHRGTNEMELAQPRWIEKPEELDRLVSGPQAQGRPSAGVTGVDSGPVADEAKLTGAARSVFFAQVGQLRTYLGLREAGKHYLLMGYAVIRRALLELDFRHELHGGIFFLTPADLPDLIAGKDVSARIAAARKRRQTELSLEVPPVLFSDDLDAIGRPPPEPVGGSKFEGVPLSAGVAEGPALVLTEPTAAPPGDGYILVCPSTDPAWVPLFVRAKGLVMETGGVLSHGAIVAREFGLPAVAGLPGITDRLKTGQFVRVDGARGAVTLPVEPPA